MANFWGKTRPFYWKTHPDNLGCFGPKNSKRWVFQKYSQAHPKIEISKRNWMCFPEKRFSITCGQWVQGVFFTFENVLGPEKDRITGSLIILHEFWGVTRLSTWAFFGHNFRVLECLRLIFSGLIEMIISHNMIINLELSDGVLTMKFLHGRVLWIFLKWQFRKF